MLMEVCTHSKHCYILDRWSPNFGPLRPFHNCKTNVLRSVPLQNRLDPINLIAKNIIFGSERGDDFYISEITYFSGNITRSSMLPTKFKLALPHWRKAKFVKAREVMTLFFLDHLNFHGNATRSPTLLTVYSHLLLVNFGSRFFTISAMWPPLGKVRRPLQQTVSIALQQH